MTPLLFTLVAIAGGLGAVCRFALDGAISARTSGALPWGTILVNLSGSLALGFVAGLTGALVLPESVHLIAGTGFLGGYTTFSTASLDTVRLLQERRLGAAAANGLGVIVGASVLAGLGLWLGGIV